MAEPANSMASSSCDHDSPALLASPHPHPWGKRVEELHEVAAGTRVAVWGKLVITGQPYANVFALYPAVVTRVNAGGIELRYHPTCRARPAEAWSPLSDGGYVRRDIEIPEVVCGVDDETTVTAETISEWLRHGGKDRHPSGIAPSAHGANDVVLPAGSGDDASEVRFEFTTGAHVRGSLLTWSVPLRVDSLPRGALADVELLRGGAWGLDDASPTPGRARAPCRPAPTPTTLRWRKHRTT